MQVYLAKQVMLTDTKRENLHKLKCPSFKFSEGAFEATNAEVHFGIELFSPLKNLGLGTIITTSKSMMEQSQLH